MRDVVFALVAATPSGMSDQTITFLVLGVTVAVFIWDRLPVGVVALGVALSQWARGVLDREQSLAELEVSPKPVLKAVCVASAASFLTPVATPANLMVMAPGGYRFGDYWKLGLPLLAMFGVVAVGLVPLIWSF